MSGSFFGAGGDPIARYRMTARFPRTLGSNDLDSRLESLALEDNLGDQLEEEQDTFNDETFDMDIGALGGQEYDFFHNTQAHQAQMRPGGRGAEKQQQQLPRRVMTLEEIESQMVRRHATPGPSTVPQAVSAPSLRYSTASPEVVAQRRSERLQRQAELSRYDNMMSRHDKDYIIRIQVSQLLTDDPAADDFYCHMYQLSRGARFAGPGSVKSQDSGGEAVSSATDLAGPDGGEYGRAQRSNTQSSMARMQQQVQRIVSEARRRPKAASHLALEGALGKISVNSARNPKQVIQVQQGVVSTDSKHFSPSAHDLGGIFAGLGDARNPAAERRKTLRSIENVYGAVLRLEQLIREQVRLPPAHAAGADHPSVQAWIFAYNEAKDRVWAELDASQPISNTYPHPLVRFLSFAKGKRIFPRVVHHMSIDQVLALTTTIIANFETLDVCRFAGSSYTGGSGGGSLVVAARQREETDLFLQAVMPPALGFLSETSLQIVNGLFALFMERNNVAWVVRSRPALGFLTMFLGRTAAAVKQAVAAGDGYQQDVYQASAELYGHLFNSLRGGLASVFPQAGGESGQQQVGPMEDVYAWQFLATLAVGASVEQQHTLVAEVREKVLEKVQLAKGGHLPAELAAAVTANINLFLNALGLDVSQVTT
ncbi:DNA topoisomerase 2-associated protein pat1 [Coemansia sp. BCRC 34301]|nr:DNA topoisomerase 2-associated protein pat1 [Coemansia sp. BCRC 34301]